MARTLGRVCAFAGVCFAQLSAGYAVTTPSAALEPRTTHPSTNTACALASKASSSYLAAETDATHARIPAELAYDCLKSVPNYREPALRLLNALRTYFEFQSDKEYLRNPPSGYLFPAVDFDAEFDIIQANVQKELYKSEYDMQLDITALLTSARDGHLYWLGDILVAFVFERGVGQGLVALSIDGIEQPQVYMAEDVVLVDSNAGQAYPASAEYTPSPVTSIDGVDVVSFLLVQSMVGQSQDPDALWNQNFFQLGNQGVNQFLAPTYYPGPSTNLTFANGTTRYVSNSAIVISPLDGVNTGDDAYAVFCSGALEPSASSTTSAAASTSSAPATSTQAPPSSPTVSLFPYPVIKDNSNTVAGYYLNDTGFTDVAVLQIQGFEPASTEPDDYAPVFQSVVQKFLHAAVKSGKSKLIIDLQGNPGGHIVLGADTFAQLFPSVPLTSKSNLRDHLGFWIVGNVASSNATAEEKASGEDDEVISELTYAPMAYQSVVTDDLRNFSDFQSYYGPNQLYGGNFSAFFQDNYTNIDDTDFEGSGIVVTGTNNRTGFRQPFAAQDIVVVYDGYCGSTCTVFSEYLKSFGGVQFIAVGGRPQNGPMQAVGGIKGSQVFEYKGNIDQYVGLFQNPENNLIGLANGTIWENFTTEPITRASGAPAGGVNGRNHFRIGDESNTPLQYVYEAADCRLWWTPEMLYDPTFLWARVATVAFQQRTGTQFNSPYCVQGSTGHPTSISGGWKNGTLGPQNVPANATATVGGWKLDGKPLGSGSGSGSGSTGHSSGGNIKLVSEEVKQSSTDDAALATLKETCSSYTGDKWLIKLICNAVGS